MRKLSELFFSRRLNILQIFIVVLILATIFFLVYSPHFSSPFPLHIDEWHSIQQAISLGKGTYSFGNLSNFELGFDFFLSILGKFMNLILTYQFFPAIWAVITAIVLFFIAYNVTDRNFSISLLTIIFFGSIRSDENLTGLWFFTPLTFAIPFIFLYMFFFAKGLKEQKKKYVLISLGIMLFLVFVHAISVLFAIPILIISCLFYLKFVKKEYKTFLLFLLIPVLGLIFYSLVMKTSILQSFIGAINLVQFKSGWAGPLVSVINNSFTEVYSIIGYILAIIGSIYVILKKRRDLLLYLIWPFYLVASILLYKLTGMSYLSPSERDFYYFVISLPLLSAIGMNYLFDLLKNLFGKIELFTIKHKELLKKIRSIILIIILITIILFSYINYFSPQITIPITYPDYRDLSYLSHFPPGNIISPPVIIPIVEPISGKTPVGDYFNGASFSALNNVMSFYNDNCTLQNSIINQYNVSYVIAGAPIDCNYTVILANSHDSIYSVKPEVLN